MSDLSAVRDAVATALRGSDSAEAVRVLCRSTARVLPVDGAAISTMGGTQTRETVCASDRVADELEELQFSLGEGPCFEAYDTNVPVLVPDLDSDLAGVAGSEWPVYATQVTGRSPARAVFAFPLSVGSLRIGTLSTYRATAGRLDSAAIATATELAETAALVMLGVEDPGDLVSRVRREAAVRDSGVRTYGHERVHVAAGMVAQHLGLSPDDAFDRIRGHAFAENRLLIDVADDIRSRRLRLESRGP